MIEMSVYNNYVIIYHLATTRPITNMRCENISIFSAHVEWTILAPVSQYQVTTHCSRNGHMVTIEIEGGTSQSSLLLESLEYDCIYTITIKPKGFNDYSLQCNVITAGKLLSIQSDIMYV